MLKRGQRKEREYGQRTFGPLLLGCFDRLPIGWNAHYQVGWLFVLASVHSGQAGCRQIICRRIDDGCLARARRHQFQDRWVEQWIGFQEAQLGAEEHVGEVVEDLESSDGACLFVRCR